MRVLLTGSSGWLGRFLAPALRATGHDVTGLDVAHGTDTDVVGSVADAALVDRVFARRGIEAVVHAGALHKPDIARFPARAFVDVNVTGTLTLLEAAARAGRERFVMTSSTSLMISRAVRDETSSAAAWLDEGFAPLAPRNIYGVTKLAAESLCRMHARAGGPSCVVLRTSRFFPEEEDAAVPVRTHVADALDEATVEAAFARIGPFDWLTHTAVADERAPMSRVRDMPTTTARRGMEKLWTTFNVASSAAAASSNAGASSRRAVASSAPEISGSRTIAT